MKTIIAIFLLCMSCAQANEPQFQSDVAIVVLDTKTKAIKSIVILNGAEGVEEDVQKKKIQGYVKLFMKVLDIETIQRCNGYFMYTRNEVVMVGGKHHSEQSLSPIYASKRKQLLKLLK